MEELILHYFLRITSLFIVVILIYFSHLFFIKEIKFTNNNLTIIKNQSTQNIINENIVNLNYIEKFFIQKYLSIYSKFFKKIHFGKFIISEKKNINNLISTITKPSNFILKITIVEGWSKKQLNTILESNFENYKSIEYNDILSDTYYLHSYENFDDFYLKLKNFKNNIEIKFKEHELLKYFSFKELMIIGSLLEKEGKDDNDKKVIFSIIKNRLRKNMKLQIDATTIYAITDGRYDLNRDLRYKDLKVEHPYNTYYIKGLPPEPISYVGKKTMEIIFENYKSKFFYYFYNNIVKKHIYSETFEEHKRKLSEFRNQK